MSRYLVTGSAGFIGSKVSELLLDAGNSVVGIDNLNDAYDVRLKHWRLAQLRDRSGFEFCQLDICDRNQLGACVRGGGRFDGVLHLAARAGVRQSVENPWIYFETNVIGTLNLLEQCKEIGVDKLVQASSSSLYGETNIMPLSEDANTDAPLSPYATSKKAAEVLCHTYHYLYGIDISVLRFFTVYGPAGRPDMSPFRFVQWIMESRPLVLYGDGLQSRDFTYVDDIARGTIAALKPVGFEIINLGSDQPITLQDAICLIEELTGQRALIQRRPAHPSDVKVTWASIQKAKVLLKWRPEVPFEEGIARMVAWYQANREWARDIVTL